MAWALDGWNHSGRYAADTARRLRLARHRPLLFQSRVWHFHDGKHKVVDESLDTFRTRYSLLEERRAL